MGETRRNTYPRLEGTGFVRVQNWLPGPVPRRTLPVTPTGFGTREIPYYHLPKMAVMHHITCLYDALNIL